MLATGELRLRASGRARAASSGVVRDPGTRRGARRRRPAPRLGYLPEGGNARRCGARGRRLRIAVSADAASRRAVCPRPRCSAQISRRTCWWARSRVEDFAMPGRGRSGARGPRTASLRSRPTRARSNWRTASVHPADRRLCRDLGHLGQRRGTLAERCGRGASARAKRVPAGRCCACSRNLLGVTGFDYLSSEDVRNELQRRVGRDVRGAGGRGRVCRRPSRTASTRCAGRRSIGSTPSCADRVRCRRRDGRVAAGSGIE